jgi:hypothetical protein
MESHRIKVVLDPCLAGSVLKRKVGGQVEAIGDRVSGADRPRKDVGVRVNERMIERVVSENVLAGIIITKENGRFPMASGQG